MGGVGLTGLYLNKQNDTAAPTFLNMTYHTKTRIALKRAPSSLGVRLGRLAVRKNKSVQEIATATGASRVTVYSWFAGGTVSNAYRAIVTNLIADMQTE